MMPLADGVALLLALLARAGGRPGWTPVALALAAAAGVRWFGLEALVNRLLAAVALRGGWYEARRPAQAVAVAALLIGGVAAMILAAGTSRGGVPERVAGAAAAALLCLLLVRLVSLHQVDALLDRSLRGSRLGTAFELALIGAIALAAMARVRIGGG